MARSPTHGRARRVGESDFTRQARQQQILVALRAEVTRGGSLLFQLPDLLDAVGQTIRTDLPVERLPDLAAILDEVGKDDVTNVVIRAPLVKSKKHPVRQFTGTEPGEDPGDGGGTVQRTRGDPVPWPTPKPKATKAPKATPSP